MPLTYSATHMLTFGPTVDGNTYGNCIVFPNGDYSCNSDANYFMEGYRKFRCLTRFTADDLNNS